MIASNAYTEGDWTELRRNFFPGYYYQVASVPLTRRRRAADSCPVARVPGTPGRRSAAFAATKTGRLLLGSLGNGNQKPAWFLKAWADRVQQHYFPLPQTGGVGVHLDRLHRIHSRSFDASVRAGARFSGSHRLQRSGRDHGNSVSAKRLPITCVTEILRRYRFPLRPCSHWPGQGYAVVCMRRVFRCITRASACALLSDCLKFVAGSGAFRRSD